MNKKITGLVAGAAGAALLLSGGTYALWTDAGTVDGGTITAGNLDVAVLDDAAWHDVSSDRTDSPHTIDLSTFRIVPGDTIEGTFGLDVGLEGDNMTAQLGLTDGGLTGVLADGLDVTYSLTDAADAVVASGAAPLTVDLASGDNPVPGTALVLPAAVDGTADYTLHVSVTFDAATSDQDLTQAQAALAAAGVTLAQVR